MKKLSLFILLAVLFSTCGTKVPVTNRRQMNMLPEKDLITMAETQYRDFLAKVTIVPKNDPRSQQVERVGLKIKKAVEDYLTRKNRLGRLTDFKWEINTVEDPTVNAWCMPGGLIVVYTGILKLVDSDDELAVVMGHEIAHAIARHGNERMSEGMVAKGIGGTFSVLMGSNPTAGSQLFMEMYGLGAGLSMLSYSRKHETEADKIGLVFAKIAGYDPNKAISFWKKMSQSGGAAPPAILSTHPSDEKRIKDLEAFIPKIDSYIK